MAEKTTKITTWKGKRLPVIKDGGSWYCYRGGLAIRHSIAGKGCVDTGETPVECLANRDARRARAAGTFPGATPVSSGPITIEAMLVEWRDHPTTTHEASRSTLKGNSWAVDKVVAVAGPCDAVTINAVEVEAILVEIAKQFKSKKPRSALNQAFRMLVKTGRRSDNPVAAVAAIKTNADLGNPTEWLTEDQAVEAFAFFAANPSREHAALATSGLAGLRPGEACALSWTEVDFEKRTIKVDFAVDRHTGRAKPKLKTDHHGERHRKAAHRTVPMPAELVTILRRQYLATGGTGFCFPKGDGPLNPQDLFYASKAVSTALGHVSRITGELCHVSPDGYRHTFASRLANRGFPAVKGAAWMGHVDTTQWDKTYTHDTGESIDIDAWLALTPIKLAA